MRELTKFYESEEGKFVEYDEELHKLLEALEYERVVSSLINNGEY